MKNNSFNLVKIRKILLGKGYKIYKKNSSSFFQSKFKGLYYTSLTGVFLILFFGLMPNSIKIFSKTI